MNVPYWLPPDDPDTPFPDVGHALRDPDGLLAVGGGLEPERLLNAYRQGIFPWYNDGEPIMWWSPDPRMVLYPDELKVSRSLRKTLKKTSLDVTLDTAFAAVVEACAGPRRNQDGTWITRDMQLAYRRLHEHGHAHSCEVWHDGRLVGGLYGVAIGRAFFGESMFSHMTDASKVALVRLARQLSAWGFRIIDCQVYTSHLARLGARLIPRASFVSQLATACALPGIAGPWRFEITRTGDR